MIEPQAPAHAHPPAPAVPGALPLPKAPPETAAPTPAPRPAAARNDLLASLGRRFRGATLTLGFELRTGAARQIFQRDFVYVSRQLHALEASRRVQGLDRQVLKEALAAVARRGDAVRTVLMLCASEARALIAVHGHAGADVDFARPTRLQATIVSPHARDYLDLIGQADDALTQLEKAWLLGLVDPHAKSLQASECRRALIAYKECVRQQRQVVGAHVREVNAARRTASHGQTPGSLVEAAADEPFAGHAAPATRAESRMGDRSSAPAAGALRAGAPLDGGTKTVVTTPSDPAPPSGPASSPAIRPGPTAARPAPAPLATPATPGWSTPEQPPGPPATVAAVVAAAASETGTTALALAFAAAGSRLRETLRASAPAAALEAFAAAPLSP